MIKMPEFLKEMMTSESYINKNHPDYQIRLFQLV